MDLGEEESSAFYILSAPSYFYSQASYWDDRYERDKKREECANGYEWFLDSFEKLKSVHPLVTEIFQDKNIVNIIDIGCGNSQLGVELADAGFNVTCIDYSSVAIRYMQEKFGHKPRIKFLEMDLLKMDMEDNSFDLVMDKGALDAILFTSSDQQDRNGYQISRDMHRILTEGGRYIVVTSTSLEMRQKYFTEDQGWKISLNLVLGDTKYLYVLTKI